MEILESVDIESYFPAIGGFLLATLALLVTKDAFWDFLEWPPALMVGAIHVDLLALNSPIFDRYSFTGGSEFTGVLLAFHAVMLMVAVNVRNFVRQTPQRSNLILVPTAPGISSSGLNERMMSASMIFLAGISYGVIIILI